MIFSSGLILSLFGETGPGFPTSGPGTPPSQDMEDLYTIRVGLDTGDTQAGMRSLASQFRELGGDVARGTGQIQRGFQRINRYLGLLGINLSGMGIARQFIEIDQAVRDFQKGMFEATREAVRGGGAMIQWTDMNEEAMTQYMQIVVRARETWRRSEQEIVRMFRMVGQSGIAAAANIEEGTDRMQAAIEETGEAVALGFQLEFLGLSAQQIQSLYHSMAVNLQMDMKGIREALHEVFVTSEHTSFAWQEHVRYVEQALARYSKFGVSIQDVSALLLSMVEDARRVSQAFQNVGMVYDLMMERLGIRAQLGPVQQMRLFEMIRPQQLEQIIGARGTGARTGFEERLGRAMSQLDPSRQFTTQDLLTRRLDPTQYLVVWQAMNEGMMNLTRLEAMQTTMQQIGPRGREMMPLWAAQMPEFATFWRQFQAGLSLDPEALRLQFQALRDSAEAMGGRVRAAEDVLPERVARGPEAFWNRVETRMTEVYDLLSGWKADTGRWWRGLFYRLRSAEYREARGEERARQDYLEQVGQRGVAAEVIEFGRATGLEAADIESARLRSFVRRFADAETPEQLVETRRRTSEEMAQVLERYVSVTPEGQRAFDPLGFIEQGWGVAQERFMGLTTPEFWEMYRQMQGLPGAEALGRVTIPSRVQELISESLRAGELIHRTGVAYDIPGAYGFAPSVETPEEIDLRRRTLEEQLRTEGLQPGGILLEAPEAEEGEPVSMLAPLEALGVEGEPVSMLAPLEALGVEGEPMSMLAPLEALGVEGEPMSMLAPGAPATTFERIQRQQRVTAEEVALGVRGGRQADVPQINVTAILHLGSGQQMVFDDAITRVEANNARAQALAGTRPTVG